MRPDRWQIVKELFRSALNEPSADREAFVARQCDDPAIRAEVLRLLRLHGDSSDFLVSPLELYQNRLVAAPIVSSVDVPPAAVKTDCDDRAAKGRKPLR